MRAATIRARIIRNLSWLIIIAIFVAGTAAKGEERLPFLGAGATTCQGSIRRSSGKRHKARRHKPNPVVRT